MRYRLKPGFAAWLLMRATGVALSLYLAVHIWVLSHLSRGPEAFDALRQRLEGPLVNGLEVMLAAALILHGANGLRIIVVDFTEGSTYHKPLFWLASAATLGGAGLVVWRLWPVFF